MAPAQPTNNQQQLPCEIPEESRPYLGTIDVSAAQLLREPVNTYGLCWMARLADSGPLIFSAKMDIDADGSPNALEIDPADGQLITSLELHHPDGTAAYVDAEKVPYIVVPDSGDDRDQRFYRRMGIRMGDMAAVIWRGKLVFAVVADVGPVGKIGEGSVALAQQLGWDPFRYRDGKKIVWRGIPRDVIYVVFPGSRPDNLSPANLMEMINTRARSLFEDLGGVVEPDVAESEAE